MTDATRELEQARVYATSILVSYMSKYGNPSPAWQPKPDLFGVLEQLEAITSSVTANYKLKVEELTVWQKSAEDCAMNLKAANDRIIMLEGGHG